MIKGCIYPKTPRVKCTPDRVIVTEKLDGSNLCIFRLQDNLFIAQRNNIIHFDELNEVKDVLYKGLYGWLMDNKAELEKINDKSCVCGEWLGMGKLKYPVDEFDKRFYMFAKANIDGNFTLGRLQYNHELFIYPFETNKIPKCIGVVPVAYDIPYLPNKDNLDVLYLRYCEKVHRDVEGFVVNCKGHIEKYVRMKNGKLTEHFDKGD